MIVHQHDLASVIERTEAQEKTEQKMREAISTSIQSAGWRLTPIQQQTLPGLPGP